MSTNDSGEIYKICGGEDAVFVGTDVWRTAEGTWVAVVVGGDLGKRGGLVDNGRCRFHQMQISTRHIHKPTILCASFVACEGCLGTIPVSPDGHVGQVVGEGALRVAEASFHAPGKARHRIEENGRVVGDQPASGVAQFNGNIVRFTEEEHIVAYNTAGVAIAETKGNAATTVQEIVALDNSVRGAIPKEDGGHWRPVIGENAYPFIVTYGPTVSVVGADAISIVVGGGGCVFQTGTGKYTIFAAVANRIDFDELVIRVDDVKIVE